MSSSYKWDKENTTRITVKLYPDKDADVIELLNSVPSKQGLIKDLLRQAAQQAKQKDDP